jgi:hypothetical protein
VRSVTPTKREYVVGKFRSLCQPTYANCSKCGINPLDPEGPCVRCLTLAKPSPGHMCVRWKVAKLSLCRDDAAPWPSWTTRYKSMEPQNITDWASDEVKILRLSHKIKDASYTLRVRKFAPMPGDMLFETWFDESVGEFKRHDIEPYAVINMEDLHREMQRYVNDNIAKFIVGVVGESDEMLWKTYKMAFERCWDHRVVCSFQRETSSTLL